MLTKPMILRISILKVVLLVGVSALAGCSAGSDATAVSGKITVNGTPLSRGVINFQLAGRRPLGGGIGSDGSYSVELPPGEYQVRIDAPPELPPGYKEGDPLPKLGPRHVPEKYASFNSSGLTATVTDERSQTINFDLR